MGGPRHKSSGLERPVLLWRVLVGSRPSDAGTFCLWRRPSGGHRYRTRRVGHVADEIAVATRYFSQVREYFFDDDTLTDDLPRIEALARRLGKLGVTWSCNAKANVPHDTLKVLKENAFATLDDVDRAGLRLPWAPVASSVTSMSLADVLDPKSPALVIAPNTIPGQTSFASCSPDRWQSRSGPPGFGRESRWRLLPEARALLAGVAPGLRRFRDRRFRMLMRLAARCRWIPGTT